MGSEDRLKEALDVLELSEDATIREVRATYRRLKQLYEKGSIATSPVEEDLSDKERTDLLALIDEAYETIVSHMAGGGQMREGGSTLRLDEEGLREAGIECLDGLGLKRVRDLLGVGIGEIELKTRINSRYLESIEEHDFASLPEEVFVQGYVSGYAKSLGLDSARAARDFIAAMRQWRSEKK